MINRRRFIKAGFLGGVGLAAGGLAGSVHAQDAQVSGRSAGVRSNRIGEHGRLGHGGYRSRARRALKAVPTGCLQCVAICGVIGYTDGDELLKIEGNPYSPNNRGMVCAKAQAGINQVNDPDRIAHPLVRVGERGEGKWKRITMREALDLVAFGGEVAGKQRKGLKQIYESDHPERFMFHYGRSRIKTAVKQFVTTGFGSKTIGNHTSICETAKWLGNELTMGKHYDINDVENSRYILIMGANVLEAHTSHSYFAQRLMDAKAAGTPIVTFDVRLSNTAALSTEWVPIRPGTDLAIVLAMTHVALEDGDGVDARFIERWTNVTVDELRAHYEPYTPEWAERESGVPATKIRRIARDFARNKPSTLVTYRGFVGHYNGAYAEWAAKVLDAVCGNMMVKGGTLTKVSGKCADAYASVAKKHPGATRKAKSLKILDGEGVVLPTHHTCQAIYEMIAEGKAGRPELYMTYCYNGAYTTGDCARNLEVLADEEAIPFFVAVDVAMSETTAMADVILPDATYLERWAIETPQSYALEPFVMLRQPVVPPKGEAMAMQDIFIQLARRIGGGLAELHPYDTAAAYCEACVNAQRDAQKKAGKPFYDIEGKKLEADPWSYLREYGVLRQAVGPQYGQHEKRLAAAAVAKATIDPQTGVVWSPAKAHVSADQARNNGYRRSKNAYEGYLGQCLKAAGEDRWDPTTARKGFKPDKFNKSGLFEVRSLFMAEAADSVLADLAQSMREDERPWLERHLRAGLPCWVPVPEHRGRGEDQLVMISFKVNVQIHSRSQNCKWLQEIHHNNPAWINPATARRLLGDDVQEGALIEIVQSMPQSTTEKRITAKVHLTEGIHPEVIGVSFHCGHWRYGRYASGKAVPSKFTGTKLSKERIWWQEGATRSDAPTEWSDLRGVHPNWIIPNAPARVSGQFRSNDTLVTIKKVS